MDAGIPLKKPCIYKAKRVMKTRIFYISTIALAAIVSVAQADVLELKNGNVLTGKYVGGTAGTIRFETGQGVQVVETGQALALTFTSGGASAAAPAGAAAAPAAAAAAPAPAPAPTSVSVPAGTTLVVRMMDGASSNDSKGKRFTTVLESDLVVNGQMVAKAGTKVYGRVENATKAGRYVGKSSLDLRLTELTVGGSIVQIVTGPYAQTGEGSLRKAARGAAAGAAIGAIADDDDGAAKGAAIGAVASGVRKGQAVVVSGGTLLEFKLQQPVTIKTAS
jgi:hypothetical protein